MNKWPNRCASRLSWCAVWSRRQFFFSLYLSFLFDSLFFFHNFFFYFRFLSYNETLFRTYNNDVQAIVRAVHGAGMNTNEIELWLNWEKIERKRKKAYTRCMRSKKKITFNVCIIRRVGQTRNELMKEFWRHYLSIGRSKPSVCVAAVIFVFALDFCFVLYTIQNKIDIVNGL